MNTAKKKRIYLAIVLLVCFIVFTTVVNWSHIINIGVTPQDYVSETDSGSPYKITVYYFPTQKNEAQGLVYYLSQQKYLIDMEPASILKELDSSRYSLSYLFFNHDDLALAVPIKKNIEQILNHPINAYKFPVSQSSPSMMVILTDKVL